LHVVRRRTPRVVLQQFAEPGETSVNQHSYITFALSHHGGNVANIKIGNYAQKDGVGLIGWQAPNQSNGASEAVGLIEIDTDRRLDGLFRTHGGHLTTPPPKLVNHSAVTDREQHTAKIFRTALESNKASRYLDPNLLGNIIGILCAETRPKITKEQRLVRSPEHTHGVAITRPCLA
jgi:hypothetical protein